MRLFGLDAWSLAVALVASGVLLAFLYLRKRPTRRVVVPALALWLGVEATGMRGRAKTPLSLLLALAIVCLLLLALADPRPAYEPSDFVLWIDRGVAMSARDVPGTRLGAAKRAAHARVDALRAGDRAQIVGFADHASALSAMTDERAALHAAIDRITASKASSDGRGDFAGRTVLFSNAPAFASDEFVRIGASDRNVGIRAFSVRSYPLDRAHASALITVVNFGSQPERVTLRLRSEVPLHQEAFTLEAGASHTRSLDDLPGQTLEASIALATPDPLPEDDRAVATRSARTTRVRLFSPGDRYLEAALLVAGQLEVTREGDYDLAIFDRTLPEREPALPALYLGPPTQGGYFPLERGAMQGRPYFEHIQATPLLAGLGLRDINITQALATRLTPQDRALASSATGTPLLVEGRRRAPFLALTFSLAQSDLALRAAFPVLILRALDQLRGAAPEAQVELAHAGPIAPRGPATQAPARDAWFWPWLAGAALLLLALEYVSFRRGWTR